MFQKAQKAWHALMLTRKYFGSRNALYYFLGLYSAIAKDANVEAFRRLGVCESHIDGMSIRWAVPNPIFMEEIIEKKCYCPNSNLQIRPNDVVVDAGANIGTFTLYAALRAWRGQVIAFEPNPTLFGYLQKNIAANGLTNVRAINGLIGSKEGHDRFYMIASGGSICDSYSQNQEQYCDLPSYTLGGLFNKFELQKIDFLKMDIEGAEFQVFNHASFLKNVERIAMELHPSLGSSDMIGKKLEEAQYHVTTEPAFTDSSLTYLYAYK